MLLEFVFHLYDHHHLKLHQHCLFAEKIFPEVW